MPSLRTRIRYNEAVAEETIDAVETVDAMATATDADLTTHEGASDPHPVYLTAAEGNSAYQPLDTQLTSLAGLSYTGNALKAVRVNAGETGFELTTITPGTGTVTDVSVVTANGVSGSVATSTTTPAITLTLGAITPTSVAASGTVTGSNLSGTNTGDQTSVSGNAGTATALATSRNFSISGGGITAATVGFTGAAAVVLSASVDAGHITLARMADMATASLIYRKSGGSGAPEVNTLATLKTDLALTGTNSGDQTITLTGDVTGTGTGSFATTAKADMSLTRPVATGTPAAEGALGYDSTQKATNIYANGQLGTVSKTIAAGVGTQTKTNSTGSDQDFTTIYTFPANTIFTSKLYRLSLLAEYVGGTSSVTTAVYVKIGSTKVVTLGATNPTDGQTRSVVLEFLFWGRAAAGASAAVSSAYTGTKIGDGAGNSVDQPVNLATNGTLALIFGVTYSGTGSTETVELQAWVVEELN